MHFYVVSSWFKPNNADLPCVTLKDDNWNDYGYYTTYKPVKYYDENGNETELGELKILQNSTKNTTKSTNLPTHFEKLSVDFCSLGQSKRYYDNLELLGSQTQREILLALNDVIYNPTIYQLFRGNEGFENSLLRFSEARKIFMERDRYFNFGTNISELSVRENQQGMVYDFSFICQLPLAEEAHKIRFDFSKNEYLPFRINALIGRNGTGKTQILGKVANSLSGLDNEGDFSPFMPLFSKVIAISYSAFDDFEKPESTRVFSYKYCGIRDKNGKIDIQDIKDRLLESVNEIKKIGRRDKWVQILREIIDHESLIGFEDRLFNKNESVELSSGQTMLVTTFTDVIANIEDESLLLMDEPELHLHPDAISNFVRMLNMLLNEFDSYAIVSTHSPIILQELPSRCVRVFERIGNHPIVRDLDIECFGENLTTITNEVFGKNNDKSNYKEILFDLSRRKSYREILELFGDNLSFNAKIYLKNLFGSKES